MTRGELTKNISSTAGIPEEKAKSLVNGIFLRINDALMRGEKVVLKGFGTFSVKETGARTGRNPHNGQPEDIPARKRVSFRPAGAPRDSVNQ